MSNLSISHPEIATRPSPRLSEAIQQGSKDDVLAAMDATVAVKRKVSCVINMRHNAVRHLLVPVTPICFIGDSDLVENG